MAELPTNEVKDVYNARQAVQLATQKGTPDKPETMGLIQLIDSLDKDHQLGVAASRMNSFLAGGVGAEPNDDPRIMALLNKSQLFATGSMLAHFGASGGRSPQMLQHWLDMANAKKMNGNTLRAGTLAIEDYMQHRAMLPDESGAQPQGGSKELTFNPKTGRLE